MLDKQQKPTIMFVTVNIPFYKVYVHDESLSAFIISSKFDVTSVLLHDILLYYYLDLFTYKHLAYH